MYTVTSTFGSIEAVCTTFDAAADRAIACMKRDIEVELELASAQRLTHRLQPSRHRAGEWYTIHDGDAKIGTFVRDQGVVGVGWPTKIAFELAEPEPKASSRDGVRVLRPDHSPRWVTLKEWEELVGISERDRWLWCVLSDEGVLVALWGEARWGEVVKPQGTWVSATRGAVGPSATWTTIAEPTHVLIPGRPPKE